MIGAAAACVLIGMAAGWPLGYLHRGIVECAQAYGRLLRDIVRAVQTGRWTLCSSNVLTTECAHTYIRVMDENDPLNRALKNLAKLLPEEALRAGLEEMSGRDQETILNFLGK